MRFDVDEPIPLLLVGILLFTQVFYLPNAIAEQILEPEFQMNGEIQRLRNETNRLNEVIRIRDAQINSLKGMQPPDYSWPIAVGFFSMFLMVFIWTAHKEKLKKLELEAVQPKKKTEAI